MVNFGCPRFGGAHGTHVSGKKDVDKFLSLWFVVVFGFSFQSKTRTTVGFVSEEGVTGLGIGRSA